MNDTEMDERKKFLYEVNILLSVLGSSIMNMISGEVDGGPIIVQDDCSLVDGAMMFTE